MSAEGTIRTLILSEIRLYRDGLAELLARGPISVVGTADNGAEALRLIRDEHPEVILLDMAMARSGQLADEILALHPSCRLVALGVAETEKQVIACAEAGVAGLLTRDSSLEDVVAMVRSVSGGETLCSPRVAATLLRRVRALAEQSHAAAPVRERLTRREVEILELMDRGLSNKEIASDLCIQPATVKNHVHHILEKLEVRRRGEAVARARGTAGGLGRMGDLTV